MFLLEIKGQTDKKIEKGTKIHEYCEFVEKYAELAQARDNFYLRCPSLGSFFSLQAFFMQPVCSLKADAVQNLTDARYFAAAGIEYMGFCLDPAQSEALAPAQIQAIRPWLSGPKVLGEFGAAQGLEDMLSAIDYLELDALQCHPFTPVHVLEALPSSLPLFQELIPESLADIPSLLPFCIERKVFARHFVLNTRRNGLSWSLLREQLPLLQQLCEQVSLYFALPWQSAQEPLDVLAALPKLGGLCLRGGEEERPGYKSFDELDEILEALDLSL